MTGCSLDVKRYNEIMYYLNKYGSHSQVVKFFVRHELFKKAAEYIKAQVGFLCDMMYGLIYDILYGMVWYGMI